MTLPSQNFMMYSGETKKLEVIVTDGNNAVVDLTGATIVWKMQVSTTQTITKDGVVTDAKNGKFTVTLSSIDTQNITGNYSHSAKLTDVLASSSVVFTGMVTINA